MASERDTIKSLIEYAESLGVCVNLHKTKARGNKGIFIARGKNFRIDISKEINSSSVLSTILHELSHFIHYKYDNSLKSLDFVLGDIDDTMMEELISVTVHTIPKNEASILYTQLENSRNISNEFLRKKIERSIKSKIYRLNKYYNSSTELFARFMQLYFLDTEKLAQIAPKTYNIVNKNINTIKEFCDIKKIMEC